MDSENSDLDSSSEKELTDGDNVTKSEVSDDKRAKIRKKLSTMSFEDIQKLKEKIGSKLYNQVILGIENKKAKTDFKRANKNRPREMSSKVPIRTASISKVQSTSIPDKKKVCRDPRFDSMCGEYDAKAFRENYKFIDDIKKNDKKQLEKELAVEKDPERKRQIKILIQRISNQLIEAEKKDKLKMQKLEEKRTIREKVNRGEKPIYKKKSEQKVIELLHKYEELKNSNKLQKHIEKKNKKNKNTMG